MADFIETSFPVDGIVFALDETHFPLLARPAKDQTLSCELTQGLSEYPACYAAQNLAALLIEHLPSDELGTDQQVFADCMKLFCDANGADASYSTALFSQNHHPELSAVMTSRTATPTLSSSSTSPPSSPTRTSQLLLTPEPVLDDLCCLSSAQLDLPLSVPVDEKVTNNQASCVDKSYEDVPINVRDDGMASRLHHILEDIPESRYAFVATSSMSASSQADAFGILQQVVRCIGCPNARKCVIVTDSHEYIQAGNTAGATVVALRDDPEDADGLWHMTQFTIDSLEDVQVWEDAEEGHLVVSIAERI